ncbi:unnamed protein product [Musa hybrid cultivar]
MEFPDSSGLMSETEAVASWQAAREQGFAMLRHLLLLLQRLRRPLQHLRVRLRRRRRMRSRRARAASPPGGASHPLRQPNGEGQSLGQAGAPPRPEPTALRRQLRRQHQRAHRLQLQERMDGEDHSVQPEGLHLQGLVRDGGNGQSLSRLPEGVLLQRHKAGRSREAQQDGLPSGTGGSELSDSRDGRQEPYRGSKSAGQAAVGDLLHEEGNGRDQHREGGGFPHEAILRRRRMRAPRRDPVALAM